MNKNLNYCITPEILGVLVDKKTGKAVTPKSFEKFLKKYNSAANAKPTVIMIKK